MTGFPQCFPRHLARYNVDPAAGTAGGERADENACETQIDALGCDEAVLVAEDDDLLRELLLRELLCRALCDSGYQVLAARDGSEALGLFRERVASLSIAVLDVTMPKLNGYEVAAQIREIRPGFPVVLCTGYIASVLPAVDEEITRIVDRPMEWKSLLEAMRELLARRNIANA